MGIGFKELVVILIIVLVLFGAKRLRNIGTDLGGAIKGFRQSMKEGEDEDEPAAAIPALLPPPPSCSKSDSGNWC